MTKTFPAFPQYLVQINEDMLCFEFRIWVIRICLAQASLRVAFAADALKTVRASSFEFTKIDCANKFVTSRGYIFK